LRQPKVVQNFVQFIHDLLVPFGRRERYLGLGTKTTTG
jgi:hypothetical protein